MKTNDNKTRINVWMRPSTLRHIDAWLEDDNCANRSEFLEKAARFYLGHLAANDASEYFSEALVTTLKGLLENSGNRLRSLLFKWCVELNMTCHTVAAHFRADEVDRRALRAFAVREVKETNGQISFDHALDVQRAGEEGDADWQG